MKKYLITFLLLGFLFSVSLSLVIDTPSTLLFNDNDQKKTLTCSGGSPPYVFTIQPMSNDFYIQSDTILFLKTELPNQSVRQITLLAIDADNKTVKKTITIKIVLSKNNVQPQQPQQPKQPTPYSSQSSDDSLYDYNSESIPPQQSRSSTMTTQQFQQLLGNTNLNQNQRVSIALGDNNLQSSNYNQMSDSNSYIAQQYSNYHSHDDQVQSPSMSSLRGSYPRKNTTPKKVTVSQAKLVAASSRAQQAIIAIANFVDGINQAKANIQEAQDEFDDYSHQYDTAKYYYDSIANKIATLQETSKKFDTVISGSQKTIKEATDTQKNLLDREKTVRAQLEADVNKWTVTNDSIKASGNTISNLQSEVQSIEDLLPDAKAKCKGRQQELAQLKSDFIRQNNTIVSTQATVRITIKSVQDKTAQIEAIRKQLSDALSQLQQFRKDLSKAQTDVVNAKVILEQTNNTILSFENDCKVEILQTKIRAKEKSIEDETKNKQNLEAESSRLKSSILNGSSMLKQIRSNILQTHQIIDKSQAYLNKLKFAYAKHQKKLDEANAKASFYLHKKNDLKELVDTAQARLTKENNTINQLTVKLEQARTEKTQADMSYNILVTTGVKVCPYPVPITAGSIASSENSVRSLYNFVYEEYGQSIAKQMPWINRVKSTSIYDLILVSPASEGVVDLRTQVSVNVYPISCIETSLIPGTIIKINPTVASVPTVINPPVNTDGLITNIFIYNAQLSNGLYISGQIIQGVITKGKISNALIYSCHKFFRVASAEGSIIYGSYNPNRAFVSEGEVYDGIVQCSYLQKNGVFKRYAGSQCQGASWLKQKNQQGSFGSLLSYDSSSRTLSVEVSKQNTKMRVQIFIPPCAVVLANMPDYVPTAKDSVVFKGIYDASAFLWTACQVTFIIK